MAKWREQKNYFTEKTFFDTYDLPFFFNLVLKVLLTLQVQSCNNFYNFSSHLNLLNRELKLERT